MTNDSPTTHELLMDAMKIHCASRHAAGASCSQIKLELFSSWSEMLDEEFSAKPGYSVVSDWPEPMDERGFLGIAGDFVRAVEPHTEGDPAGLLLQYLAAFGSAAGRHSYIRVEDDRHYPNLYVLVFGRTSSGRKGTSLGRVLASVSAADKDWAERCILRSGLSSGEGLVSAVRDSDEASRVPGVADKRLLALESEFGKVLGLMGRDGSTLSATLRNAWDSGDLSIQNKNSPCRATGAHISVVGHVTRDEFRDRLDSTELSGGTLNRFLHVAVARSKSLPHGGQVPDAVLEALTATLQKAVVFAQKERELVFTYGARGLWETAYPVLTSDRFGQYGAATARAAAQALRLALVFALLDCSEVVDERHVWAALAVWDYCDRSAVYVYGDRMVERVQDRVLGAIRGQTGWIARGEVVKLLGNHISGERLAEALKSLGTAGLIERREEGTGGRPREMYRATKARKAPVLELCWLSSHESEDQGSPTSPPSTRGAVEERDTPNPAGDDVVAEAGEAGEAGMPYSAEDLRAMQEGQAA